MGQLIERLDEVEKDKILIVVCHHGIRSRMVARYLIAKGFVNVINLTGGIDAWSNNVDPSMPKYA